MILCTFHGYNEIFLHFLINYCTLYLKLSYLRKCQHLSSVYFNNIYDLNICYNFIFIIILISNFPLKLDPTYEMVFYIISNSVWCTWYWISISLVQKASLQYQALFFLFRLKQLCGVFLQVFDMIYKYSYLVWESGWMK